jgi:hypothetical protein
MIPVKLIMLTKARKISIHRERVCRDTQHTPARIVTLGISPSPLLPLPLHFPFPRPLCHSLSLSFCVKQTLDLGGDSCLSNHASSLTRDILRSFFIEKCLVGDQQLDHRVAIRVSRDIQILQAACFTDNHFGRPDQFRLDTFVNTLTVASLQRSGGK